MFVPFVDLKRINNTYRSELISQLKLALDKSDFILGESLLNFEKNFARFTNSQHCIGVGNGTDALYISLRYFKYKIGAEIIVPSNSWVSTSEIVSQAGYKVVFCDVDPNTHLININSINKVITENTVGVIPVHLYGQMADMPSIREYCKNKGLWIIEDSAQAHGASCEDGNSPGFETTCATYSFFPGKNLGALGDGGAICSNNEHFSNWARLFSRNGGKNIHTIEGINSRLDSLQSRFLALKLENIEKENQLRIEASQLYRLLLKDIDQIKLPTNRKGCKHVYHVYCIVAENRDNLKKYLEKNGIQSAIHYKTPLPFLPAYSYLGYKEKDFPELNKFQKKILSIPIFPGIKKEEQEYVAKVIKDFYKK